jgi:hypothetical protein
MPDSEIDPMPCWRVLLRFYSILADRHAVSQIRWMDCKGFAVAQLGESACHLRG